jgi:hypothetical protein
MGLPPTAVQFGAGLNRGPDSLSRVPDHARQKKHTGPHNNRAPIRSSCSLTSPLHVHNSCTIATAVLNQEKRLFDETPLANFTLLASNTGARSTDLVARGHQVSCGAHACTAATHSYKRCVDCIGGTVTLARTHTPSHHSRWSFHDACSRASATGFETRRIAATFDTWTGPSIRCGLAPCLKP